MGAPFEDAEARAVSAKVEQVELLSFAIAGQEYAVDILDVQEIRVWERPTRLPNAPPAMLGVVNLRGNIVPVLDLRARFGLEPAEYGGHSVQVILSLPGERRRRLVGIAADSVSEVHKLPATALVDPPALDGAGGARAAVRALAEADGRTLLVLDTTEAVIVGRDADAPRE